MKRKIAFCVSVMLMVAVTPISSLANFVDENGCEWGISDNPIIVGDNSHGAEAEASHGSSDSNTQVSGSNETPSATIEQETSGGSGGKNVSDNTTPGDTWTEYAQGGTTTEQVVTPGSESGNSSGSNDKNSGSTNEGSNGTDSSGGKKPEAVLDKDADPNKPSTNNSSNNGNGSGSNGTDPNNNGNSSNPNSTDNGNNEPDVNYYHVYIGDSSNEDAWNEDGSVKWDQQPGSITNVTVDKNGNMIIHAVNGSGKIVELDWSEYWSHVLVQSVFDKDGNFITKTSTINLKEDVLEEWTYLYTAWTMMNETNSESRYYGGFTQVAKTQESSAKLWPDLDGRYRVIGTPWFRVRYYRIVEQEDCTKNADGTEDCTTWEEKVTVGEDILSKSPTKYSVDVPLICQGCPVPVMCINGGCDPKKELNAVGDDANAPQFDIESWTELEK